MHKAGSRHTDIRHESTSMHTPGQEGLQMIEATSCGGVVIFRGKLLVLYKNYRNKYEGWVLPKGIWVKIRGFPVKKGFSVISYETKKHPVRCTKPTNRVLKRGG